jgi:hypothetical protein
MASARCCDSLVAVMAASASAFSAARIAFSSERGIFLVIYFR